MHSLAVCSFQSQSDAFVAKCQRITPKLAFSRTNAWMKRSLDGLRVALLQLRR
jgi:hypothetical protein